MRQMRTGQNRMIADVDHAHAQNQFGTVRHFDLRIWQAEKEQSRRHGNGGTYRVRPTQEIFATSSPSMDISKASNFERFIFDLVDRRPERVRQLWHELDRDGQFSFSGDDLARLPAYGFVSGRSTHHDRLATIRSIWQQYSVMIDTHTADGVFVANQYRKSSVPMICLETALPAKFADAIQEALGMQPPAPSQYADIEARGQKYTLLPANASLLKQLIAGHCASGESTARAATTTAGMAQ